jgi:uncharacterized protein (TIGR00266 family)
VNDNVWWLAVNGSQVGPMSKPELVAKLNQGAGGADALVFGPGLQDWKKARDVGEIAAALGLAGAGGSGSANGSVGSGGPTSPPDAPGRRANEIDFKIVGAEMQFVEVELDPGESAVAEAGAMMYMSGGIAMETIFGDGSQGQRGFLDALVGAGKRLIIGETMFMTVFQNRQASGKERVAFAAPYAGKIVPIDLRGIGGELICQKDSFLCAARGVSIGIAFQKKFGVGLFGGEGFIMERLQGDGLCFVHAGGTVHPFELGAGETMRVDTGCIVALLPSVRYDIQFVGNIKTALFGGEGIFFATLTGPGKVWLQSLPFSRLAGRIVSASSGWRKEEGSVLDRAFGLGRMIDGD